MNCYVVSVKNQIGVILVKKSLKIITALILCISLFMIPMQVMAAPEAKVTKPLYISEVKVGMGSTSEEAAKELLEEGFTIINGDDGKYADLNEKAGSNSVMKEGLKNKIVYIGYKTTDDPKKAITDLAVMNMNGGYSVQDYETLMANHLEGEIKPFVDRFISALEEYRENYKKPDNTLNHIRADYYRQMLNKLTDDDTGGKPLGDLLLNETKYEMGDDKYNDLSDAEKKNHADILTILMQGNGRAIILLETLVTKSTDSADNTWLDRFVKMNTDDLIAQIKKDDPSLTTEADIMAELDKKYNDTAMKLYQKWDDLYEIICDRDDSLNEIQNAEPIGDDTLTEKVEKIDLKNPTKEDAKNLSEAFKAGTNYVGTVLKLEELTVVEYLSKTEYGDGSLLDFFERDMSELSIDIIRSLYPLAASLSKGQIAGLDFISFVDLFNMALVNEEGYTDADTGKDIEEMSPASVYQDVDREIYEPGGVALTNAALRTGATKLDDDSDFILTPLGFVFWGLTGLTGFAAIKSYAVYARTLDAIAENGKKSWTAYVTRIGKGADDYQIDYVALSNMTEEGVEKVFKEADQLYDAAQKLATKSKLTHCLYSGFTVVGALLAGYSIYTTFKEMIDYYKVNYTPIPKFIVDEADITQEVNGTKIVINNQTAYYKVVPCNRKEGSSDIEKNNYKILGTSNDLNGDVGKQWLALYSVRYEYGNPILADSFKVVKGSDDLPSGYETGIHRFGEKPAFNLTSKYYCFNDDVKGTYVYFKNGAETVAAIVMGAGEKTTDKTVTDNKAGENTTGSFFSAGSLALGAGAGLLLGGGIAVLILLPIMKKKKEQQTAE